MKQVIEQFLVSLFSAVLASAFTAFLTAQFQRKKQSKEIAAQIFIQLNDLSKYCIEGEKHVVDESSDAVDLNIKQMRKLILNMKYDIRKLYNLSYFKDREKLLFCYERLYKALRFSDSGDYIFHEDITSLDEYHIFKKFIEKLM